MCTARGYPLRESADARRTIATVSAIGGAVLPASGIGLWLAMPSDSERDAERRRRLRSASARSTVRAARVVSA